MNATAQSSPLDFRSTAVDLAAQLQHASRNALLLADELARAERVAKILIKYMPAAQMIHARLEIDEATTKAHVAAPFEMNQARANAGL